MNLDFYSLPVVDSHCHPFDPLQETQTFEQYWTLSTYPQRPADIQNTMLYQMVLRYMAQMMNLDLTTTESEILEKRNVLYRKDPNAFIDKLFRAAGIECLLLDIGYPTVENCGYSVDMDQFVALLPPSSNSRIIVRIESIMDRLFKENLSFPGYLERFNCTLDEEIRKHKAVAIKSVIAYHTGLGVEKIGYDATAKAFDAIRSDPDDREAEKIFRDFFIWQTIDACLRHDLPLQLHTGIGDSPQIDLRLSNPLLLYNIFSDNHYGKAKIVMVHCGYPYTEEAGFLINNYPNLYLDISEMVPFASIGVESKLLNILEMGPFTKILYGSDGYNIPELFWFSAIYFKKVLGYTLQKFIDKDIIDKKYAFQIANLILNGNAKQLYQL